MKLTLLLAVLMTISLSGACEEIKKERGVYGTDISMEDFAWTGWVLPKLLEMDTQRNVCIGLFPEMGIKITRTYVDSPIGDVEKTHADISKAKKELGYKPAISFEKGIKKSVEWCSQTSYFDKN